MVLTHPMGGGCQREATFTSTMQEGVGKETCSCGLHMTSILCRSPSTAYAQSLFVPPAKRHVFCPCFLVRYAHPAGLRIPCLRRTKPWP